MNLPAKMILMLYIHNLPNDFVVCNTDIVQLILKVDILSTFSRHDRVNKFPLFVWIN